MYSICHIHLQTSHSYSSNFLGAELLKPSSDQKEQEENLLVHRQMLIDSYTSYIYNIYLQEILQSLDLFWVFFHCTYIKLSLISIFCLIDGLIDFTLQVFWKMVNKNGLKMDLLKTYFSI